MISKFSVFETRKIHTTTTATVPLTVAKKPTDIWVEGRTNGRQTDEREKTQTKVYKKKTENFPPLFRAL